MNAELIRTIGRITGILSIFLLGLSIFAGGASRMLGKRFKLDKVLKFHKRLSYTAFCLLVFHPLLIIYYNIASGLSLYEFFGAYISQTPFIAGLTAFFIFFIIVLFSFMLKLVGRSTWLVTMRFSFVAFALALYHQIFFGSLSSIYSENMLFSIIIFTGISMALAGLTARLILLFKNKK